MNATENQSNSRHQRGERPKNMSKTSTKPAKALLIEEIRQLGQTLGVNTVFTTFLEITATCLSAETDPSTAKDRKARYQELIEGMEPETVNAYARMCALLYLAVRENWDEPRDILGAVYHELNLNNAWNGQYFTPDDVCRMMAMLTLGEDKLDSANQELLTINEPACGSGAMVIGAVWAMKKSGTDYRNGSITREAFLQKKSELVQRKELLAQEKGNLQEQVETLLRDQRDMKSKIDQLAAFSDLQSKSDEELRKQMYDAIDRVTVYCSRELDITWKMGNIFAGTFEKEPVQ